MKFIEILKIGLVASLPFWIVSCDDDDEEDLVGNWVLLSPFDDYARSEAVSFSIGELGYVGTGYNGEDTLSDFWSYDPKANTWTQMARFRGVGRRNAVGFSTDTKGYLGTGYDGRNELNDFWEYDPVANEWNQIADFGGSARHSAVAFSINNKGYVGTGYDGMYLKDIWQYDPDNGTWTKKNSFAGYKRKDAVAFVLGGKGYICTGISSGSPTYPNDLYEYDPTADSWTRKNYISAYTDESFDDDYDNIVGTGKVVFTMGYRAFLVGGGSGTVDNTVWEYDQTTDLWVEKAPLEAASPRTEAVAFTVNDVGYVTMGRSSSLYLDDIWSFEPDEEYEEHD